MTERIAGERVGLVVNPHAGRGETVVTDIVRRLIERLAEEHPLLVEGTLESRLAAEQGIACRSIPRGAKRLDARETACRLLDAGVGAVVGVGGDGTMCDIAAAMAECENSVPLLGIGVGSANVGPLISLLGQDVGRLTFDRLCETSVHGIDAFVSGKRIGTAFNDVAIANSFFGTRNGRRIDLDAAAKLAGEDRVIEPASVCGPGTWVAKNGRPVLTNADGMIAQLIASPINAAPAYAGKAISGLMCWGPYVENHGVLSAASTVMIRTRLEIEDINEAEPLRLSQISFGADDRVEIGCLTEGAVLVIDGNPLRRIDPADVVVLRMRRNAMRVLHLGDTVSSTE